MASGLSLLRTKRLLPTLGPLNFGWLEATAPPRTRYRRLAEPSCLVRRSRPTVRLFVERGLVVNETTRTDYAAQTIFLDGAFDGPPFIDNERRHYSLDHHAGCVRAFTLATCEQAAVMVAQGMPLSEGQWQLFINQPDLDALLAAWVLLNHDLDDLYPVLNERDPNVTEEDTTNRWGGSSEIGGSPRRADSALTAEQVLDILAVKFGVAE